MRLIQIKKILKGYSRFWRFAVDLFMLPPLCFKNQKILGVMISYILESIHSTTVRQTAAFKVPLPYPLTVSPHELLYWCTWGVEINDVVDQPPPGSRAALGPLILTWLILSTLPSVIVWAISSFCITTSLRSTLIANTSPGRWCC